MQARSTHSRTSQISTTSSDSSNPFKERIENLTRIPVDEQINYSPEDFEYTLTRQELDESDLFEYLSAQQRAEYYVDVAISRAVDSVNETFDNNNEEKEYVYTNFIPKQKEFSHIIGLNPYAFWPTVNEFDKCKMISRINEYVSLWRFQNNWSFIVSYLSSKIIGPSEYHYYEALFSLPTPQYPTPQLSVSVFFYVEICHCIASVANICVHYVFEGQTYKHVADGQYSYQEEILLQILEGKWRLYHSLKI